ncbi:hypothetical protein BGZ94_005390, partial [Podila epigama]
PENIIMFGHSVKLADFGLATTEVVSSDFGCGSTFYLSPECQGGYVELVKSYNSAANDVWSLGVILINLVFGRNPWKQACPRDETFSAYILNNDFLQTILPMSAELNEIIKAVFCLNPRKRITLPELARRVQACTAFTTPEFSAAHASSSSSSSFTTLAARTTASITATTTTTSTITPTMPTTASVAVASGANRAVVMAGLVGHSQVLTATGGACIVASAHRSEDKDQGDSGVDLRSRV